MRFHRPDSGLGLNDKAVAAIRAARKLESRIPLWSVKAANEVLSEREPNEAYTAAAPGRAYALYFPAGGDGVTLDLSTDEGMFNVSWIDVDTGEWGPEQVITAGTMAGIRTPGDGNWAAAILKKQ